MERAGNAIRYVFGSDPCCGERPGSDLDEVPKPNGLGRYLSNPLATGIHSACAVAGGYILGLPPLAEHLSPVINGTVTCALDAITAVLPVSGAAVTVGVFGGATILGVAIHYAFAPSGNVNDDGGESDIEGSDSDIKLSNAEEESENYSLKPGLMERFFTNPITTSFGGITTALSVGTFALPTIVNAAQNTNSNCTAYDINPGKPGMLVGTGEAFISATLLAGYVYHSVKQCLNSRQPVASAKTPLREGDEKRYGTPQREADDMVLIDQTPKGTNWYAIVIDAITPVKSSSTSNK